MPRWGETCGKCQVACTERSGKVTLCLVRLMNVGSLVGKQLFEFVEHKHLVHRLQEGDV